MGLSKEKTGKLITMYRKRSGYTQNELAEKIGISRSTYLALESGKRILTLEELMNLSEILDFNVRSFIDGTYESKKAIFNINKFRNVLYYILTKTKKKENVGLVVLFKLLYFSDFDYYNKYKEYLTGLEYTRLPMGPVPKDVYHILDQEVASCSIELKLVDYYGGKQKRYTILIEPTEFDLTKKEQKVIDDVLEKHSDKSGYQISEHSHGDAPWVLADDYGNVDYENVFKRTKNYAYE